MNSKKSKAAKVNSKQTDMPLVAIVALGSVESMGDNTLGEIIGRKGNAVEIALHQGRMSGIHESIEMCKTLKKMNGINKK